MSNYLRNLVSRATESGPMLQPRLPSRYEPVAKTPKTPMVEDLRHTSGMEEETEMDSPTRSEQIVLQTGLPQVSRKESSIPPRPNAEQGEIPKISDLGETIASPPRLSQTETFPPNQQAAVQDTIIPADDTETLPPQPAAKPRHDSGESAKRTENLRHAAIRSQLEMVRSSTTADFPEHKFKERLIEPPSEAFGITKDRPKTLIPRPLIRPESQGASSPPADQATEAPVMGETQSRSPLFPLLARTQDAPVLLPSIENKSGPHAGSANQRHERAMVTDDEQDVSKRVRALTSAENNIRQESASESGNGLRLAFTGGSAQPDPPQLVVEKREQPAVPVPPPSIEVHIGRIEVRATPPPAKPLISKEKRQAVMNLDDYLQQRNKQGGAK